MKKRLAAGVCAVIMALSVGTVQAFAARGNFWQGGNPPEWKQQGERPEGKRGAQGKRGVPGELTEAEKAQIEAAKFQREEKLQAFINSLSKEQKALFEAIAPVKFSETKPQFVKPENGKPTSKPDAATMKAMREEREAAMKAMKENKAAFISSLTESQKAAYDELFCVKGSRGSFEKSGGGRKAK